MAHYKDRGMVRLTLDVMPDEYRLIKDGAWDARLSMRDLIRRALADIGVLHLAKEDRASVR